MTHISVNIRTLINIILESVIQVYLRSLSVKPVRKKSLYTDGERKDYTIPICDSDIIVFLRSQSGEIGSSISVSLSPCGSIHIQIISRPTFKVRSHCAR